MPKPKRRSTPSGPLQRRINSLSKTLSLLAPVPQEWLSDSPRPPGERLARKGGNLESSPCNSYREVITAWRKALKWRQELDDVLSVMLAVALSTERVGDQLFLQVIGEAGGGKTRLCDAMLVSPGCYALEHLTGFHSGWKDESGEDFSLIARIDRKTLITPEGDVLMSSPHFVEIMSQQRRIFDGTSGASYKNRKEDMRYTGLRTPWIIAGTPALMETDQSRLGDRFLRVILGTPSQEEEHSILRRVGYTALRSVVQTSDGYPETQMDERLCKAYKLTGGYVDWLQGNASELLSSLANDDEWIVSQCEVLAGFTAFLRARPNPDSKRESQAVKELPSRLMAQYIRLACCLAVVLNEKGIGALVMRRVRKVALDTSRGQTLQIAGHLHGAETEGSDLRSVGRAINQGDDKTRFLLRFLESIGALERFQVKRRGVTGRPRYRLTSRLRELYSSVMEVEDAGLPS